MHTLLRRVAMGLALSLMVGAPAVLLAEPAYAAATGTVVVLSDATPVYGQEVLATATVTSAGQPVTVGTVQFLVKDPAGTYTPFGAPVPLNPAGTAVSAPVPQQNGTPMDPTQGSDHYRVRADYVPPSPAFDSSSDYSSPIQPGKADSSIAILPGPTTIVADVTGKLPGGVQEGSLKPSGPVSFTVNGAYAGSAELDQFGQATLSYTLAHGPQNVVASYAGDSRYEGSSEKLTRSDPTITARVLSRLPRAKSGWYRTPVDIWFKCDPAASELVVDCPENVRLRKSGKNQSVTRTITAVDGGSATVTVSGIDIDRRAPVITIDGRSCRATDKLSGVKRNRCTIRSLGNGRYVAIAVDRAGNRAVKRMELD